MLGAGPLTQLRVLRFAPAHSTETRRKPPATADGLGGVLVLAFGGLG